jgi:acyl-[acyl-carrier-protein]-phospholipid O-acyltransferase/long-chain-fatty-acid--[acyl-carrier-protein] ligase
MDQLTHDSDAPAVAGEGTLFSLGFQGLLWTQFLTAVNDNVFRWLVIGIGKEVMPGQESLMLGLGTACFVLPYLVLAAPAGYLADRFSKATVIFLCKVAEIILMAAAVGAILLGRVDSQSSLWLLFVVLTLMGAQAALFSPSRAGSIPEILKPGLISKANGMFGLATVLATIVGMALGSWLSEATKPRGLDAWHLHAAVLIGIAALGTATTLLLPRLAAGDVTRKFPWNAPQQMLADFRALASNLPMVRVALGIAFFYAIGSMAQLAIDQLSFEHGGHSELDKVPLLIALILGVCLGNILAAVWSGDHVELGLLPLGSLGMAVSGLLFFTIPPELFHKGVSSWPPSGGLIWTCLLLVALGSSAGLFNVPLEAYLQHRSPRASRGSILAASNFLTFFGILLASGAFSLLRLPLGEGGKPLFTAPQIFMLAGLLTLPVFVYIVWLVPQSLVRFFVWLASMTIYRIRVYGRENLPREGGALLVPNHVTWIDGIFLLLSTSRPVRMIALSTNLENRWLKWLSDRFGAILINPTKPKMVIQAFRTAREALNNGELVCIFAEGGLTRTGQVQAFRPGMMKILEGTTAPVVPVYLDELWGSIFSFEGGKFFWKWPRRWPYPISISYGPPIARPDDAPAVRQAVMNLGAAAVTKRTTRMPLLTRAFIRRCKQRLKGSKVVDTMGSDYKGEDLLLRSLILRRLLRRHSLQKNEQYVGVLLPPSGPGFLVNMALALDKRTSVNLNYTVSNEVMNACIKAAGIKHVITSRKVMSKMNFQLDAEVVYLEDFAKLPTIWDKAAAGLATYVLPASVVEASLGLGSVQPDDVVTIIFTSGSTGTPKGVMLTYANVASNVEAIETVVHLTSKDVLLGILPFFHSFGYTVTLWTVASLDVKGAYHYSPLDARQIGRLCKEQQGTILLTTPTFLRSFLRRCEKEDFATLDVVVAGAEKLPKDLCDAFEEKFGVRPVEGYGTTELSPLVSVNVPPSRSKDNFQVDRKEGTVGRCVPGVSAKITHLETGEDLKAGESGMLWITGPNVMKGYLHHPEQTAKAVKDGWYMTGDVAFIDDEGFIHITGRESRFSKIGGEMVPHIKIEETLNSLLTTPEEAGGLKAVVTAIPDDRKGERLVVVHTKLEKTPSELSKGLSEAGLPNLFIPGEDSYLEVAQLPVLGTGKLDLKGIKQLALEKFGGVTA